MTLSETETLEFNDRNIVKGNVFDNGGGGSELSDFKTFIFEPVSISKRR